MSELWEWVVSCELWVSCENLSVCCIDCMFSSCHVRVFRTNPHSRVARISRNSGSKQARYVKFKWLQRESNPQPLSSKSRDYQVMASLNPAVECSMEFFCCPSITEDTNILKQVILPTLSRSIIMANVLTLGRSKMMIIFLNLGSLKYDNLCITSQTVGYSLRICG